MPDQIPAPVPPPTHVATLAAPEIQPSAIQVFSATLQNLAVIAVLGYGWLQGKLDTTVAVVALLLVVGIDFANRRRLPTATGTAAAAFGATSVLHALGVTGTVAIATLAFVGCGAAPAADLAPAKTAIAASASVYELACTNPQVYALIPQECEAAYTAVTAAVQAYNAADKAATEAASK